MPAPEPSLLAAPMVPPVSVALQPALNSLNSLLMLSKIDWLSGLDEWVLRTYAKLTPEQ